MQFYETKSENLSTYLTHRVIHIHLKQYIYENQIHSIHFVVEFQWMNEMSMDKTIHILMQCILEKYKLSRVAINNILLLL